MKAQFRVTLEIPDGASKSDMRAYIKDAVQTMCGGFQPDNWDGEGGTGDPLFYLDRDSVKVQVMLRD